MAIGNGQRRGRDASLAELVAAATRDVQLLVRQEIELAKSEVTRQLAAAAIGIGLLGVAGGLMVGVLIAGTIFLGELVTWAGLERFLAYLVTAGGLGLLAGLCALVGLRRLRGLRPPRRAIASVREDLALLRRPGAATSTAAGAAGRVPAAGTPATATAVATPAPSGATPAPTTQRTPNALPEPGPQRAAPPAPALVEP
ncbi:MAG: phage holin family protein [Frankia sp.]|nr:phage holin family protein [Frankia sp.]